MNYIKQQQYRGL